MPGLRYDARSILRRASSELEDSAGNSPGGLGYVLRELSENLEAVARDPSRWSEFAEAYALTPDDLRRSIAA